MPRFEPGTGDLKRQGHILNFLPNQLVWFFLIVIVSYVEAAFM